MSSLGQRQVQHGLLNRRRADVSLAPGSCAQPSTDEYTHSGVARVADRGIYGILAHKPRP
jgi:hypothetical protein